MSSPYDFLEGDVRGVIDHYLAESLPGEDPDRVANRLEGLAEELRDGEYLNRSGVPHRHLDPDDAHGRFGGNKHYRLIQSALHRVVNRYYEKNARITVENEELEFRSSMGGYRSHYSEKTLHPDIYVKMDPGESGMATEKVIVVECETRKDGLLRNDLRTAAYNLLRQGNQDRNELMIYLAFPAGLRGDVDKPEWANDLWFFEVGGDE